MVIMSYFRLYKPEANSSDPINFVAKKSGAMLDSFVSLTPREERRWSLVAEDIRSVANQADPRTVFDVFCEQYQVTEDKHQRALKDIMNNLTPSRSLTLEERDASTQVVIRTENVSLR